MKSALNNGIHSIHQESKPEPLCFAKLHATLCLLMTEFHSHQCPKLAQFIVKHIALMIQQPEIAEVNDSHTLYLQLLRRWQNITGTLLKQRKIINTELKTFH